MTIQRGRQEPAHSAGRETPTRADWRAALEGVRPAGAAELRDRAHPDGAQRFPFGVSFCQLRVRDRHRMAETQVSGSASASEESPTRRGTPDLLGPLSVT